MPKSFKSISSWNVALQICHVKDTPSKSFFPLSYDICSMYTISYAHALPWLTSETKKQNGAKLFLGSYLNLNSARFLRDFPKLKVLPIIDINKAEIIALKWLMLHRSWSSTFKDDASCSEPVQE